MKNGGSFHHFLFVYQAGYFLEVFGFYKVGPPFTIAKLVNTTPMSHMVYGTYNYSYWGLKTN